MNKPNCPVCMIRLTTQLKEKGGNGRVFLMLVCPSDGAHFRAFINDRDYVANVVDGLKRVKS